MITQKQENSSFVIAFVGNAGSGKGTQTKMIEAEFRIPFINAGAVLRERAQHKDDIGEKIRTKIDKGERVAEDIINNIMFDAMKEIAPQQSMIIDGYPRSMPQLHGLDHIIEATGRDPHHFYVIYLNIADETAMERVYNRSSCKVCKAVFRTRDMKVCPVCGGAVEVRMDDTLESIQKRIQWFYTDVMPVVEAYRSRGVLIEVDGSKNVEEVHRSIVQKLKKVLAIFQRDDHAANKTPS